MRVSEPSVWRNSTWASAGSLRIGYLGMGSRAPLALCLAFTFPTPQSVAVLISEMP